MINYEKVKKAAMPPRQINLETYGELLESYTDYKLYTNVFLLAVLVFLGILVTGGLAIFEIVPWIYVGYTAGAWLVLTVLCSILKKEARNHPSNELINNPLTFAAIVQANSGLFEGHVAPAVLVYSIDPSKATDPKWAPKLAKKLYKIKEGGQPSEKEEAEIYHLLHNEHSNFVNKKLPASVAGDESSYWTVKYLNLKEFQFESTGNDEELEHIALPFAYETYHDGSGRLDFMIPVGLWT